MKVYVLTTHTASCCEFLGIENQLFRTKKKALKAFEEWKKDEMFYVKENGWKIGTDTEEHFEAYEEGYYCQNHTEGFVNEYEI